MGEFNSDEHYIYYCGQESLRRHGVAIMVNKRVKNAVLGCNLKNDRMISVCLQGKPFNITVIQVYAPTTNAEEAEVERFYEDLKNLLELTPQKRCLFHYRRLEGKSRKSRKRYTHLNAELQRRAEVERFYEDPQDLLEEIPLKYVLLIIGMQIKEVKKHWE